MRRAGMDKEQKEVVLDIHDSMIGLSSMVQSEKLDLFEKELLEALKEARKEIDTGVSDGC